MKKKKNKIMALVKDRLRPSIFFRCKIPAGSGTYVAMVNDAKVEKNERITIIVDEFRDLKGECDKN